MDFVPLSIGKKFLYTFGSAVGLYLTLQFGSMKGFSGMRRGR